MATSVTPVVPDGKPKAATGPAGGPPAPTAAAVIGMPRRCSKPPPATVVPRCGNAILSPGTYQRRSRASAVDVGANQIATQRPMTWPVQLLRALRNPLVILLSALAAISLATSDLRSAVVMAGMVALGVAL